MLINCSKVAYLWQTPTHFDVIVIGSGPGGEGAAMGLTKAGLNVAIIEKESSVGGGCTHWGTIPSKALAPCR